MKKIGFLKGFKVLKIFLSSASTILQLSWLNKLIKINVWNSIVSSFNLLVGSPLILFGVNMRLNDSSKKISGPKYIRITITKI